MADQPSPDAMPSAQVVGLLCGGGLLPLRVTQALKARGVRVVALGIRGEADPVLADVADSFEWTGLAKIGGWIKAFGGAGADAVLMLGSIRKQRMFDNKAAMLPDWRSVKVWYGRLRSREDHTILGAVADEFEKEGLRMATVPEFCPELLVRAGCLTRREPSKNQRRDIRFGWPIAKQIAALQVGQCIVVKDRAVMAVEGIDGTDAVLERGGRLAGGDAIAVKVAKEGHDERFDIPCIGLGTVDTLRRAGVALLALEADRTIVIDRDDVARQADDAGICIVALTEQDVESI